MIDDIVITASGTTEPVTLEEAKVFLKVDYNDSDDLINDLITSAREQVEAYCLTSLVTHTVNVYANGNVDDWLPYYPVTAGTITVVDENDNSITFNTYGGTKPRVNFSGSESKMYTIEYNTTANTNKSLRIALMHLIKWMFDNSEIAKTTTGFTSFITDKMNVDAKNIMDQFRLI